MRVTNFPHLIRGGGGGGAQLIGHLLLLIMSIENWIRLVELND